MRSARDQDFREAADITSASAKIEPLHSRGPFLRWTLEKFSSTQRQTIDRCFWSEIRIKLEILVNRELLSINDYFDHKYILIGEDLFTVKNHRMNKHHQIRNKINRETFGDQSFVKTSFAKT